MKVLILKPSPKDLPEIRDALDAGMHEIVQAENSQRAWEIIQNSDVRFVIADAESSDVLNSKLIQRAHGAEIPSVYFLLLTTREELHTEADDILHKPFKAVELQMRLAMGQRILALVDSLSQAHDQLESTSMYDPLTGTLNQAAFNKFARSELERARRASSPLSIIALDIDHFKALNDKHGVETGNEILRFVAENIRERSRSYDFVGRWTGHEFIMLLHNVNGQEAETITRRILSDMRFGNTDQKGASVDLSVSAGIVSASDITESTTVELLIRQAQEALAQVKGTGGCQVDLAKV
jgi:two-component system, cell cycle response regulator